jgi:hypothetical protein
VRDVALVLDSRAEYVIVFLTAVEHQFPRVERPTGNCCNGLAASQDCPPSRTPTGEIRKRQGSQQAGETKG